MIRQTSIVANTLPDAWFDSVYAAFEQGRRFIVDEGSYAGQTRLEFDWVNIHIIKPWLRDVEGLPLIPEMPEGSGLPTIVSREYVREYASYIMTADKKMGEAYTYGGRLTAATLHEASFFLNQIERIIEIYKKHGHRNNQMVLQIAQPSDLLLADPPCLRHIDTRIQDGALHFFPYFRSWDLWNGFPVNLAGISMLQEYMAGEIGVKQGEMICTSKGLHIYGYAEDLARIRTRKN